MLGWVPCRSRGFQRRTTGECWREIFFTGRSPFSSPNQQFSEALKHVISRYADVSLVVIQQPWLSGLRRLIFTRRTWAKVPLSPVWVIRGVRKDIRSKRLTKRQWRAVVMYYVV